MSVLTIENKGIIQLSEGSVTVVGKDELGSILRVAELKDDFLVSKSRSDFYLERSDSNLYDSSSSIVFISLLEDASLSVDYIGREEVVIADLSNKTLDDVYQLLTTVNDAVSAPNGCVRVMVIYNFKDMFKDNDLLSKFMDYIKENNVFVAVD